MTAGTATRAAVSATEFERARAQVVAVTPAKPAKPEFGGVLVELRDDGVRLVATDAHRLAIAHLDATVVGRRATALVAAGALPVLRADAELVVAGGGLLIHQGDDVMELPALPATFPAYESFATEPAGAHRLVVERVALVEAIEQQPDGPLAVSFVPGVMQIGTDATADIPARYSGPDQRFVIDPAYLHDAASAAHTDTIVLHIAGPLDPLFVRSADDDGFLIVIMPVRVATPRRRR